MRSFTTIIITGFCFGLLFGQIQDNNTLAMGRKVEMPKILSIEECKKIAEKDFQTHLDILLKAPEVHPGDKERRLAEYNLLNGAKITDWTVYLGYDDLPYAAEFLFKKDGRGVYANTVWMRDKGGTLSGGGCLTPEILQNFPGSEVQLTAIRVFNWIDKLKKEGWAITDTTPYKLYYLWGAHSGYFVVFQVIQDNKLSELEIDLYEGPLRNLRFYNSLDEIKKIVRERHERKPKRHIEEEELEDLNKDYPGKSSFPPEGHFDYKIDNVPNYLQSFLGHHCGPTSCTDVMMYWQNQGYLDGASPGKYADDFATVIGEDPPVTQIPKGFKEVARMHDETFQVAAGYLPSDAPLSQAYRFFENFVYQLGEMRPVVLCDLSIAHANCCWEFEGEGNDENTWKYWVWNTWNNIQTPIKAWIVAENRWHEVFYALGWPVEPPEVYYTDPPSGEKGGAEDVDIYKNILIAFTKTMDRTSVESAIEMKNLDKNSFVEIRGIEWQEEDKTILLWVYDPVVKNDTVGLQYNTNYQVVVLRLHFNAFGSSFEHSYLSDS